MLALIFNGIMFGLFDFINVQNLGNIDCDQTPSFQYNITEIEESSQIPQTAEHCTPQGLPWPFYAIWVIIDGVLIYAFIPFVK
jgi:hypothetical protein